MLEKYIMVLLGSGRWCLDKMVIKIILIYIQITVSATLSLLHAIT